MSSVVNHHHQGSAPHPIAIASNHHVSSLGSSSGSNNIIQVGSGRCGPSLVSFKNLRFLITDKPTDATLNQYIEELQRRRVTDVVRVCESTYSSKRLEQAGIQCHDWAFDDGTPPPPQIISDWLDLIVDRFKDVVAAKNAASERKVSHTNGATASRDASPEHATDPCIAVHCVAGLGRAPVLVAIALIEAGLKYEDAVEMIRAVRRGAINAKQLQYLSTYKPKKMLMFASGGGSKRKACCIQ